MMPQLAAWLHNLDPYLIDLHLWEGGPIRWYGLAYLVGFVLGYLLIRRVVKVGICSLNPAGVADLVVVLAVGVVIGGRLGYVLFYQPQLLWSFYGQLPFWGVLAMNQGGMASHGGIIGTILACLWYARRHGHSKLFVLDLLAFGAPLGLFLGRLTNFINGELIGRGPTEVPWAVKFPQEINQSPEMFQKVIDRLPPASSILPGQQPWTSTQLQLRQTGQSRDQRGCADGDRQAHSRPRASEPSHLAVGR